MNITHPQGSELYVNAPFVLVVCTAGNFDISHCTPHCTHITSHSRTEGHATCSNGLSLRLAETLAVSSCYVFWFLAEFLLDKANCKSFIYILWKLTRKRYLNLWQYRNLLLANCIHLLHNWQTSGVIWVKFRRAKIELFESNGRNLR